MTERHLSEDEQWLLRLLNKHCPRPCREDAFEVIKKPWPPTDTSHPAAQAIGERMSFDGLRGSVDALRSRALIGACIDNRSVRLWPLPEGKDVAYELEHPDLLTRIVEKVRRHPVVYIILAFLVVSALFVFFADVINVIE